MEEEDDIIDINSDSDVEIVPKKATSRARKQPAKAAPKKVAAVAAAKKAPAKKAQDDVDEMQVDDVELSLADRMKKRMVISPPGKQKKPSNLSTASAPKVNLTMSTSVGTTEPANSA